jgi:hypothetical protein
VFWFELAFHDDFLTGKGNGKKEEEKVTLDLQSSLLHPMKVVPPPLNKEIPQFITEEWLKETMEIIRRNQEKKDYDNYRIEPMALVRCTRGGKTRTLKEISRKFQEQYKDIFVIFISFNDWTEFYEKVEADPLVALCRRIALVSLKDQIPENDFTSFLKYNVTPNSVLDWLGDNKCLLLIDELNKINCLTDAKTRKRQNLLIF